MMNSTLENSARTQDPADKLSMVQGIACKKRTKNSSDTKKTAVPGAGQLVKNKRTRYSAHQTRVLKEIFESTPYPDYKQLTSISQELSVDKEVVKVWFKNRRARQKAERRAQVLELVFQQERSLPRLPPPTPIYYYPVYPRFQLPYQQLRNCHGNSAFKVYRREQGMFEGMSDAIPASKQV